MCRCRLIPLTYAASFVIGFRASNTRIGLLAGTPNRCHQAGYVGICRMARTTSEAVRLRKVPCSFGRNRNARAARRDAAANSRRTSAARKAATPIAIKALIAHSPNTAWTQDKPYGRHVRRVRTSDSRYPISPPREIRNLDIRKSRVRRIVGILAEWESMFRFRNPAILFGSHNTDWCKWRKGAWVPPLRRRVFITAFCDYQQVNILSCLKMFLHCSITLAIYLRRRGCPGSLPPKRAAWMNVPIEPGLSCYLTFDRRPNATHTPSGACAFQSVITSVGNIDL